jgi:hypothetical protein
MNHPYELSDGDFMRIKKAFKGNKTILKSLTSEELEAYSDHLYDVIAAKLQTHEGSTALQ